MNDRERQMTLTALRAILATAETHNQHGENCAGCRIVGGLQTLIRMLDTKE